MKAEKTLCPSGSRTILTISGNEILEGKLVAVNFRYSEDEKTYKVYKYIFAHNGEEILCDRNTKFYENLDCLNKQIPIEPNDAPYMKRYENRWYFNGLAAEKYNFSDRIDSFTWDGHDFTDLGDKLPKALFVSPEDAVAYETQTIIREDGTVEVIDGPLKPLLLTDEQKAIADEFKAVVRKMDAANIGIILYEDTPYLVNDKHIEDTGFGGDYETAFVPSPEMACRLPILVHGYDEISLRLK